MSGERYCCASPRRLTILRDQSAINGIDYLEIGNPAQTDLRVVFAHPLPGEAGEVPPGGTALVPENFVVLGGERPRGIRVTGLAVSGREAVVSVDRAGDFSTYTLALVADATLPQGPPPAGFDPWLARIDFSFKVECPSDFDCLVTAACDEAKLPEPVINYLAKDYDSFRRLLIDRMALQMPDWQDRSAADQQVMLVELLAYLGDQLSQYQDSVAAEAYLHTARLRRSVARHVRMLDYRLHEGTNARTFAHLAVSAGSPADGAVLPAASRLFTALGSTDPVVAPGGLDAALAQGPTVFETMSALALDPTRNAIALHTWSDAECCLPAGATRAWLVNEPDRQLAPGELLLLEEVASPRTGLPQDADPSHRHVVRLTAVVEVRDELEGVNLVQVDWARDDALPFALWIDSEIVAQDGTPQVVVTGLARGNIVPADHGLTAAGIELDPPTRLTDRLYEPRLPRLALAFREPYDHGAAIALPAAALLVRDPGAALPAITLTDGAEDWLPQIDLLRSRQFDPHFVAEPERDGHVYLRFGNDRYGRAPSVGATLTATLRQGGGSTGNIGADTLAHVETGLSGITLVRNPLPATGGSQPESLDQARAFAPSAYRVQRRAVVAQDYAEVAQEDPDVQRAVAEHFFFGSWYTVIVTVDGRDGRLVTRDDDFRRRLMDRLDTRRMAGVDLQLRDPTFLNLDLRLHACAGPGRFRADVRAALLDRFTSGRRRNGLPGFFHPDNQTFGKPLYMSEILAAAMEVDGVASAEITRVGPWGHDEIDYRGQGMILPGPGEVVRLENNASLPEHGVFSCLVEGGL